jgi:hypothetical protein
VRTHDTAARRERKLMYGAIAPFLLEYGRVLEDQVAGPPESPLRGIQALLFVK